MKIYFKISGMFISSNNWEFDFPDNTKLSNLLDYLTSNTDLIDETNTVWGIKEDIDNFRKSLGFVLIDSQKRIRTLLNDYKNDLLITEIPSNLKAVKINDKKFVKFTFGTDEYKQMLDYFRNYPPKYKVNVHDYRFPAKGVLIAKQPIPLEEYDTRYIYVIGILNDTQNNSYSFGQISRLDYDYLCNNLFLPFDTYVKYAKKRPLYNENDEKNYFTDEDISRYMIYRRSKWGELKDYA